MGMFIVKEGVRAKAIKEGDEWYGRNFVDLTTRQVNVFEKCELVVDPTGVSKVASVPQHRKTVGGDWAKKGWYGFCKDGWILLVPGTHVQYG